MILCDLCREAKECLQKEIDGKEFDICANCWNAFAERLKGASKKESGDRSPTTAENDP